MGRAMKDKAFSPAMFLMWVMWGFWMLWAFGVMTVWARLNTELDGTIVSSRDVPFTGAPRYGTDYIIRGTDGRDHVYAAGCTDASLQRSMPVGTHIHKERWSLGYERDSRWISFPTVSYSGMLGVSFSAIFWGMWGIFQRRNRMDSH